MEEGGREGGTKWRKQVKKAMAITERVLNGWQRQPRQGQLTEIAEASKEERDPETTRVTVSNKEEQGMKTAYRCIGAQLVCIGEHSLQIA